MQLVPSMFQVVWLSPRLPHRNMSLLAYPLNPLYPFEDWQADLNAWMNLKDADLHRHFLSRYSGPVIGPFRAPRSYAAKIYFVRHREAFNQGDLAVMGEAQGILTMRVVLGLWVHWARADIDPNTYNPPVSEVVATCLRLPFEKQGEPPAESKQGA